MAKASSDYGNSVFVNCPFDGSYTPLFEAMVFTIFDCGFRARCALEIDDSGQIRIEKIFNIIAECRFELLRSERYSGWDRHRQALRTVLPSTSRPAEETEVVGRRSADVQ